MGRADGQRGGALLSRPAGKVRQRQGIADAAIAGAAHVTTLEFDNQRLIPNAIEPRCAIGDYDESREHYTLYTTSQNPHLTRLLISAFVMGIPENKHIRHNAEKKGLLEVIDFCIRRAH